MKSHIQFVVPAVVISFALMLGSGCSKTEREEIKADYEVMKEQKAAARDIDYREKEWNKAIEYANKGYEQLDKFDKNLSKTEPVRVKMHLQKAAKDFSDALTHMEKAEVGKARQGAVDDLNSGVDALNKAYNELDEGRVDAAQLHFDEANRRFSNAQATLQ